MASFSLKVLPLEAQFFQAEILFLKTKRRACQAKFFFGNLITHTLNFEGKVFLAQKMTKRNLNNDDPQVKK